MVRKLLALASPPILLFALTFSTSACFAGQIPTAPTPQTLPAPQITTSTPPAPALPTLTMFASVGSSPVLPSSSVALSAFFVGASPTAPVAYRWTITGQNDHASATSEILATFPAPGRYEIEVRATDADQRSAYAATSVVVSPAPVVAQPPAPAPIPAPSLSAVLTCSPLSAGSPTACNVTATYGATLVLSAAVSDVSWDWGDGVVSTTTAPIATHSYTIPGSYTVSATVTAATVDGTRIARALNQIEVRR